MDCIMLLKPPRLAASGFSFVYVRSYELRPQRYDVAGRRVDDLVHEVGELVQGIGLLGVIAVSVIDLPNAPLHVTQHCGRKRRKIGLSAEALKTALPTHSDIDRHKDTDRPITFARKVSRFQRPGWRT